MDKKIAVSEIKGLLNSIRLGVVDIEFNCAVDNVKETYKKMVNLLIYANEIERICNDIYEEESKDEIRKAGESEW